MEFIDWRPPPDRNVEVTNDTTDLHCYFDCTAATEFLYCCVARTVGRDREAKNHETELLERLEP